MKLKILHLQAAQGISSSFELWVLKCCQSFLLSVSSKVGQCSAVESDSDGHVCSRNGFMAWSTTESWAASCVVGFYTTDIRIALSQAQGATFGWPLICSSRKLRSFTLQTSFVHSPTSFVLQVDSIRSFDLPLFVLLPKSGAYVHYNV